MAIEHVLFDADGVLQDLPGGWYAAMEPYLGDRAEEFLLETWQDELPMLAGRGDYLPLLAATLVKYNVSTPAEEVYADVWHRIRLIEPSIEVVRRLRVAGFGVHLATNQERLRGTYMRSELGYDQLFDVSCYSYELGAAKPDGGFFEEAARRIGVHPSEILFIDDSLPNVMSARATGLNAEQWHFEQGHDVLNDRFGRYGITIDEPASGRS